ncbi:(2Fe-2S)-binding protein [Cohnella terricola]|uniref:(2Fe-2S)-binding protein n=1 Tax=Cohnella terricola TaxID=1289167 RepID=UPI00164617D4|nr:IucA/IucC family C-terminal-domain containing protein [Cohnella terricola]
MDLSFIEDHFHISATGLESSLLSVPASQLLEASSMRDALEKDSSIINGVGLELAVSHFGLAFFGLAASQLIVMSRYNRILDLSIDNLTMQIEDRAPYPAIVFIYHELRWTELPEEGRENAVKAEWTRYFRNTLNPLIESAASAAGLKPALIWNQYGARILYVLSVLRKTVPEGAMKQTIEDDFRLLTSLPGETFNRRKNPFDHSPCYLDSPYEPGGKIMIRSGCCMYYRRESGTKCYNCPILKDRERAEMKARIEAEREKESVS